MMKIRGAYRRRCEYCGYTCAVAVIPLPSRPTTVALCNECLVDASDVCEDHRTMTDFRRGQRREKHEATR